MAADNIELDNLLAGDDVATDLIATDHYQIIKMTYGALGSQTIASSGAGAVDAGVPRTTLASDDPAVALLGTIDGKITACNTGAVVVSSGTVTSNAGTNLNTSALLTTTAHDAAFGIAGTADAQVRSVQGIAGGTALPVSGTVTANPASGTIDTITTVTTANLAAETTKVIGTVNIAAAQTIAVTATNLDCQSGGADMATAAGQLADGHGVAATLGAETTKVIGTVRMASGGVASGSFASGALAAGAVTDLPLPSGAATSANQVAKATGGHTYYTNTDTSALATIKASAGTLYWLHITSTDATPVFVTFYDATSPTLGTAPVLCFPVPTQGDGNGAGLTINFGPHGIEFTNSIKIGAATTFNGSTDPGTNVVITNVGFE